MKPANFPARKNQRRIEAIDRLKSSRPCRDNLRAIQNTKNLVIDPVEAFNIKTKKRRA
jgi:hypothetical protein